MGWTIIATPQSKDISCKEWSKCKLWHNLIQEAEEEPC
jgi:hypothetical protein